MEMDRRKFDLIILFWSKDYVSSNAPLILKFRVVALNHLTLYCIDKNGIEDPDYIKINTLTGTHLPGTRRNLEFYNTQTRYRVNKVKEDNINVSRHSECLILKPILIPIL